MTGGEIMGMTDKQFNAYQKRILRELEYIMEELASDDIPVKNEKLENLVNDLRDELSLP